MGWNALAHVARAALKCRYSAGKLAAHAPHVNEWIEFACALHFATLVAQTVVVIFKVAFCGVHAKKQSQVLVCAVAFHY